jgi:NTP pyrophosphatase (non-canonical NTP hydrolase)
MNNYQRQAKKTAVYPKFAKILYPGIGLVNESGELLGKIKKLIRGDYVAAPEQYTTTDYALKHIPTNVRDAIIDELGDVLWYVANLASDLGVSLEEVANRNLAKLEKRSKENTIKGDGDYR